MQERLLVQSNALLPVCWSRTSDATQALVELNNPTDIIHEFHNIVVATQNLPSRINGWLTEPQLTDAAWILNQQHVGFESDGGAVMFPMYTPYEA